MHGVRSGYAKPKNSDAMIVRRRILSVLGWIAIALFSHRSPADEAPVAFADWVRALYEGAIALREAAEAGAGSDLSDDDLQALFTPEVQVLRAEARDRAPPPTEPEGPILHVLFGWGALPNRRVALVSVDAVSGSSAAINLTIAGNPVRLLLSGVYDESAKSWRIDDIDYGEGGPDRTLRGRLMRMKDWPKR